MYTQCRYGIVGYRMRMKVQKWGNSLAIRIPRPFAEELGVDQGTEVEMSLEAERLVVQRPSQPSYTLADLLAKVSNDNIHAELPVEGPVGREVW
jgi:antitoxin MazE